MDFIKSFVYSTIINMSFFLVLWVSGYKCADSIILVLVPSYPSYKMDIAEFKKRFDAKVQEEKDKKMGKNVKMFDNEKYQAKIERLELMREDQYKWEVPLQVASN